MSSDGKKSGCLKKFVVLVLLAVAALGALVYCGGKLVDAQKTPVDAFMGKLRAGDVAGAYGLTASSYQQRVTRAAMQALLEAKQAAQATIPDGWQVGPDDSEGADTLEAQLKLPNGSFAPLRFSVLKMGESYQITDIGELIPKPVKTADAKAKGKKGISFSFSTANLKNVGLSADPDGPRTLNTEFPENVDAIYFCADLCNAMDDTEVVANWYVPGALDDAPAMSKSIRTGSAAVTFNITRSEDILPTGEWRLDVLIDGKSKHQQRFTVREATLAELRKAADAGSARDAFLVFRRHLMRGDTEVPADMAFTYLEHAAERGHPLSMYNLGVLYDRGIHFTMDSEQAKRWYRKAAATGNGKAQFNLARTYAKGGSAIEIEEALNWTRKTVMAGADPYAHYALGLYMLHGTGIGQDTADALEHMEAAAQASPELAFLLGSDREVDNPPGFADLKEARRWYQRAADQGDASAAKALQRLGETM